LRSGEWYAGDDRNAYLHRAWMRRGAPPSAFSGRPQIAIANTASDLTPCNCWELLYVDHVQQADTGGDLDFLIGASGPGVAREPH
jgi:dihydroxy-acid dehydratase